MTHDTAAPSPTWRVLIQFQDTKVAYMVHIPTEEQQRGYPHEDRLYERQWYNSELYHLQLFTNAATADEAKAKSKRLLLEYVGLRPASEQEVT